MGKLTISADRLMLLVMALALAFLIYRFSSQTHPWEKEALSIVQKNCPVGTSTKSIKHWLFKSGNVWKVKNDKNVTIFLWSHTLSSKASTSKEVVAVEVFLDGNHKVSGYGNVYQEQLTWP